MSADAAAPQVSWGSKLLRGSTWLWLQQAADLSLVVVFTSLALRWLGPEGFGSVVLVQSILNLAGLGTFNLEVAAIRLVPSFREGGLWRTNRALLGSIWLAKLGLSVVMTGVLFLAAPWVAGIYHNPELVLALRVGCLSLFSAMFANVGAALALGYLQPQLRTWMTILRRACEITGLLVLGRVGVSVPGVVLVLGIADTVVAVGFILAILRFARRDPTGSAETVQFKSLLRRSLAYCTPLYGAQWTDIASHNLDKLVIGGLTTPAVLGFYSVARLASERLMLILSQAPQMAVPVVTQLEKAEDSQRAHRLIRRLLEYQWGLALLGLLAGWAAAPIFVLVVGGRAYGPAADGLRILLFAVLMWAGTVTLHVYFMVHERTLGNFLVNVANLVCAVVLYRWFVPGGGMLGAAAADVIAQALTLVLAAWLAQRWFQLDLRTMLRPLGWQFAAALLLMLPVWVFPGLRGWRLLPWAVTALIGMSLLLLRSGLPDRDELLRLRAFNWGKLNPIITYGTGLVLRLIWLEKGERSIPPRGSPLDRR